MLIYKRYETSKEEKLHDKINLNCKKEIFCKIFVLLLDTAHKVC